MSRILVTGSVDGLGRAAAEALIDAGHDVILHARNDRRASAFGALRDRAAGVVVGDLSVRDDVLAVISALTASSPLDAVLHNAGVVDGAAVMPVNVVAPYLMTALLPAPHRHVYISSGMHRGGHVNVLDRVDWSGASVSGTYSDSKLFVTALALAVARLRTNAIAHAVDPGWVPTKMGGPSATDDLEAGHHTQEWLISSNDPDATRSGGYWFHQQRQNPHPAVTNPGFQDRLLQALQAETGVVLTAS
ncbi:SDR family NAD(P)-dependent oxidoreductase [Curtobacterium sp. USHLN213]|uniref:SDR family NAD(P)-dependent oxidoreductase n=1 Tax=Curtobacterium sp. USHLN213 TaxID=3081255 RepID=UPI00301B24C7